MAAVKRQDTVPEIALRRALFATGLRYRLASRKRLPGRPDVVFPHARVALFVDGCFWHGCPLHGSRPKNNAAFWAAKLERNTERDRQVDRDLQASGWLPVHVWEHEIKGDAAAVAIHVWAIVRSREAEYETASEV
jgi:DNA mismatch endonuclease (patch repair protein)